MTGREPPAPQREGGFVLVLALWVMVIVALAASTFAERVAVAVETAQAARRNGQAAIDMAGARAEVLYRLATTSLTPEGLGRGNTLLVLDDRPYRTLGDTTVRVQDTRGLLNLNLAPDDRVERMLGIMGVPAEARGRLVETLRDYSDEDRLRRLNGAEQEEYAARNLPPPPNHWLRTPGEIFRVLGWADMPQLRDPRFLDLLTTESPLGFNPNTAPREVLATFPGLTEPQVQAVLQRRSEVAFQNPYEFAAVAGIPGELVELEVYTVPGHAFRITQSTGGLGWAMRYTVSLTPNARDAPWRIEHASRVALPAAAARASSSAPATVPELPPRSTALPDAAAALKLER